MDTGAKARSIELACKAIRGADWRVLFPLLVKRALHILALLGWAEGRSHRPAGMEACELLNTAVSVLMSGDRTWRADLGATPEGLSSLITMAMFNVAVRARRRAARNAGSDGIEEALDDGPSESRRFYVRSLVERVLSVFMGDEEAQTLLRTMMGGDTKPAEMTEVLGWAIDRVTVVLRRIRRRCRSLGMTWDYDRASGPPSSDPQGRDHGNQEAAGRRDRAAHEPSGRLGVAR
jgi:hypothetical protein